MPDNEHGGGGSGGRTFAAKDVDESDLINTDPDQVEEDDDTINWNGESMSYEEFVAAQSMNNAEDVSGIESVSYRYVAQSLTGIFGMPYQFSEAVDPPVDGDSYNIGRKYNEKILSIAPVLFLTPGEPVFMAGYKKDAKQAMATKIFEALADDDSKGGGESDEKLDEGKYYSFASNFPEYKKYANTALRALAYYMGIQDCEVPIPGKDGTEKLRNIDIEHWMDNKFTRLFGTQTTLPFFLDAETSISEDFSNDTTESMVSQTANGFSSTARELQFIMGSKDSGGLLKSLGKATTEAGANLASAFGDLGEAMLGKNLLSRVTSELTTIVSGGKIVFPEIWGGSSYNKSYNISFKFRSPDPDPVSIFLNIYMPIVLLVSMTAPRQINASSNAYESPFLVRATYKSIFSCDLGIIQSLSIQKGGQDQWNTMGQPITADVNLTIKDLYSDMFISKQMGLIANTAQMDYLATMAGTDLNIFEPLRMLNLAGMIISNIPGDFASNLWGGFKRTLNQKVASMLGTDYRFLN